MVVHTCNLSKRLTSPTSTWATQQHPEAHPLPSKGTSWLRTRVRRWTIAKQRWTNTGKRWMGPHRCADTERRNPLSTSHPGKSRSSSLSPPGLRHREHSQCPLRRTHFQEAQLQNYSSTSPFEATTQEINSESSRLKEKGLFCGENHLKLWLNAPPHHIFMFFPLPQVLLIHKARSPPVRSHIRHPPPPRFFGF